MASNGMSLELERTVKYIQKQQRSVIALNRFAQFFWAFKFELHIARINI